LFCGTNDGYVSLFDVGVPSLPTYEGVTPKQLLKLFPDYGENAFAHLLEKQQN
jgi:hypothetical protein